MAWVLLEDEPERGLGPALAWALRQRADALHVLAERATGLLARRAGGFHVADRGVARRGARRCCRPSPSRCSSRRPPPPAHLALVDTIVAGGAVPVVEHGVVTGEVRGLEVCRVVDDPHTGAVRLEVGVGAHDREAFAIIHGDVPTVDALAGVVRAVTEHRGPECPQHPLNRLAPERLLRWRLEQHPAPLGLASLAPAQPPVPRPNVKDRVPCTAIGRRRGRVDGASSCARSASTSTSSRTRSTPGSPRSTMSATNRASPGRSGWSRRRATSCR